MKLLKSEPVVRVVVGNVTIEMDGNSITIAEQVLVTALGNAGYLIMRGDALRSEVGKWTGALTAHRENIELEDIQQGRPLERTRRSVLPIVRDWSEERCKPFSLAEATDAVLNDPVIAGEYQLSSRVGTGNMYRKALSDSIATRLRSYDDAFGLHEFVSLKGDDGEYLWYPFRSLDRQLLGRLIDQTREQVERLASYLTVYESIAAALEHAPSTATVQDVYESAVPRSAA
jgi:hypothetical protein